MRKQVMRAVARVRSLPPAVTVLGVASAFVVAVWVSSLTAVQEVDVHVKEASSERAAPGRPVRNVARSGPDLDDPRLRYGDRLQEAQGVVLSCFVAVALAEVYEQPKPPSLEALLAKLAHERGLVYEQPKPRTVEALLAKLAHERGLPPGVERAATAGVLESPHATIYVRYRPSPVGVEVVSVGREGVERDGEPILVRMSAEDSALVFTSLRERDVQIPEPFATPAQVAALGWRQESLRDFGTTEAQWQEVTRLKSETAVRK